MGFSHVCCMCIFIIILYESMYLQNVFICFNLYIYNSARVSMCMCFNLHTVWKVLRGIAQLDVRDVIIWYQSSSFQH
jgi:hypothetical protein